MASRLSAELQGRASGHETAGGDARLIEQPRSSEERIIPLLRPQLAEAAAAPIERAVGVEEVPWPDETAEAAFLSEARERGEPIPVKRAEEEAETDVKPLPALEALVDRIPPAARDALEDLFRAKFVRVQRVPKKVLKK